MKNWDRYTKLIINYLLNHVSGRPKTTRKALLVIALANGAIELVIIDIVQIVDDELVVATLEVGHREIFIKFKAE